MSETTDPKESVENAKTSTEHVKLTLTSEPYDPEDPQNLATLRVTMFMGNPSLVVFGHHPSEAGKTYTKRNGEQVDLWSVPVRAATDMVTLKSMLLEIEDLARTITESATRLALVQKNQPEDKETLQLNLPIEYTMDHLSCNRDANGVPDLMNKFVVAKVHYGIDEEGYLYLEVINKNRPTFHFRFKDNDWHKSSRQSEVIIRSAYMARAWCQDMATVGLLNLHDAYNPDAFKDYLSKRYGNKEDKAA